MGISSLVKLLIFIFSIVLPIVLVGLSFYGMYDTYHTAKLDEPLTNGVFIKFISAMIGGIFGFILMLYPSEVFED